MRRILLCGSFCVALSLPVSAFAQVMPSFTTPGQIGGQGQQPPSNMGFDMDENGEAYTQSQIQSMQQQQQNSTYMGFSGVSQQSGSQNSLGQADSDWKNPPVPYGAEAYAGGKIDKKTPMPYGAEYMKGFSYEDVQKKIKSKAKNACENPFDPSDSDDKKSNLLVSTEGEKGGVGMNRPGYGNEVVWGKDAKRCADVPYPTESAPSVPSYTQVDDSAQIKPLDSRTVSLGDDQSEPSVSDAGFSALPRDNNVSGGGLIGSEGVSSYQSSAASPVSSVSSAPVSSPAAASFSGQASTQAQVANSTLHSYTADRRRLLQESGLVHPSSSFGRYLAHLSDAQINHMSQMIESMHESDPNKIFTEEDLKVLASAG